ncbi:ATP-dependent transcriptional activator MalT [Anaerohalosphaera lusitana]|uniref:ATP-dependent transcriptional activator MalT n=1 Tax=Anaerohalosphaera lusitana TaxID=1936003 RepID=A0A1U9NNQ1_9BACT|nr:helix-turn-helix transcriptional regulator [Anaerohalosphaera lusitana]AQT69465.1 ATP-dependent transcriptional activator MalT [Anaerohalosphaera lusitana]
MSTKTMDKQAKVSRSSEYHLPSTVLLDNKQWLYIQRRYRMTPREVQIVKLVCQGLSNKEIADILDVSSGTIKAHIRNIYRKSWVHTRIEMLIRFLEDVAAANIEPDDYDHSYSRIKENTSHIDS